jgi:hypothetical protein
MDIFGGTGGLIVIAVIVIASVGKVIVKVRYKKWLTKYVRSLDDDEYVRVREINHPTMDDDDAIGNTLLKKLRG